MRPGRRKKIKKTEKTYKFLTRMKGKIMLVFYIIIRVVTKSNNHKIVKYRKNPVKWLDSRIFTGYNEQACNKNAVFLLPVHP